jgi:hypothetical protein
MVFIIPLYRVSRNSQKFNGWRSRDEEPKAVRTAPEGERTFCKRALEFDTNPAITARRNSHGLYA